MRILELLGEALRPLHSDESKLIKSSTEAESQFHRLTVSSSAFRDDDQIPQLYTIDGSGLFPTLSWSDVPATCKSLLLVVEDPDAPKPTPFIHGVLYNIPPSLSALPEGAFSDRGIHASLAKSGIKVGKNTVATAAYMPPSPPPGHGPHHYHFQIIALDSTVDLAESQPTLDTLKEAIAGHVLATGELVGIYEK